ncbi:monothiol glutaredoxin-5, mitochondrial-like [Malus domestica]|uniref:monothiol glutaredoxin-5, mitochondrial-like n=1 Tax=Malus domestica TaxID=3750 RepID=UPI0010AAA6B1|nr:monothiol glutaredoxin-5-like [Malus domestica]
MQGAIISGVCIFARLRGSSAAKSLFSSCVYAYTRILANLRRRLPSVDVKDNPVMLYMKGVPELPQCGFSSLAVRVLKLYQVPLACRKIE